MPTDRTELKEETNAPMQGEAALHEGQSAPTPTASDAHQREDHVWQKNEVIREGFKNKTKGEAKFNAISYIGVGYGLVTATSVLMTWLLNDTKQFSGKFGKLATAFTTRTGLPRSIASIGTLFLGGTIASVLPVKWLEDKKSEIVKKLDESLYTPEELKDPKIKAAHQELDEMPKQTWLSVFGSRVVAFAATFGVFFLMGSNKSPLAKHTGQSIDKLSTQFGRWFDGVLHKDIKLPMFVTRQFGDSFDGVLRKGSPAILNEIKAASASNAAKIASGELSGIEVLRDQPNPDRVASRVWSYIGLDAFYTAITSASLFVFTRIFGGLVGKSPTTEPQAHVPTLAVTPKERDTITPSEVPSQAQQSEKPTPRISSASLMERVAAAPTQNAELTA